MLAPGFADPVHGAQQSFRAALDAMARPGRLQRIATPPGTAPGLSPAAAALLLALADFETPIWLDASSREAADYLRFHCGAPVVADPAAASFAVVGKATAMPRLAAFSSGSDAYPERGATVIVEVADLAEGGPLRLTGPGIQREHRLTVTGLPETFFKEWALQREIFPRGVDVFLTRGETLCGLPRTVAIGG